MVTSIVGDIWASGNGTGTSSGLVYPTSIAAGDKLYLFCLFNNGTATTTGTGITPPSGFTQDGTDHVYSSSMAIRTYVKTAAGTETGTVPLQWGGGTTASRTFWGITAVPAGYTVQGYTWQDQASLTTATCGVPAYSHTGADQWFTMFFVRGSTDFGSISLTSSAATTIETALGTSSGACSGGFATYNSTPDRDGSVGNGTWQTDSAASAGRVALTFVATLARVSKTTSTTWNTRARVAKTTATTYDTRARVAKTTATTWDTRARIVKSTGTTWDVAGSLARITKATATTWNTLARVAKTTATTWDVAGALTRVVKTTATTWNTRARVTKTTATTWDTRKRVAKTTAATWNLASMISEASWPAFVGHRGSDPGPEETLWAYDTLYGRSPNYWHEGDAQTLSDASTQVGSHDDTIDRMYASGPVSTGNISSMSVSQWNATQLRVNTGFTGSDRDAMFLTDWITKYGKATVTPAVGLWENKTGTDIADTLATFAGCQGTVVINCNSLADAQAAVAVGFDACYQTNTPTFSQFTSNGIKYLSINYTSMTGTIATNAIAAGVKVLMYTVNSTANRDSMLALFSDDSYAGFISNKPQTLAGTTRVGKTTATTWNVRARVAKTTATTWTTRARVVKATAASFNVYSRTAKTTATTWDVRARVAKSVATTWNTRARVTRTTSTTWDVDGALARVGKTTATTWDVRQRINAATATTWHTRARIAKATATSYDVRARLAKSAAATWDVRQRVAKTGVASWDVRQRVVRTVSTAWDVRRRVVRTASTTWDVLFLPTQPATPAPPERTYRIAAESRVCAIEPETRTYRIPAETRTLEAAL